jgi:hypothetical protein
MWHSGVLGGRHCRVRLPARTRDDRPAVRPRIAIIEREIRGNSRSSSDCYFYFGKCDADAYGGEMNPLHETEASADVLSRTSQCESVPAQEYEPCGGCGEKNPNKRCLGCMYPFPPKVTGGQP